MTDDVHEPLEQYASYFKTAHANNTSNFFEALVRQSGIDEEVNVRTVQQLRELEKRAGRARFTKKMWQILLGAVIGAILLVAAYVLKYYSWYRIVVPAVLCASAIYGLYRIIKNSDARLKQREQARDDKLAEAWAQMSPLNQLYDWDIVATLVQQTMPSLAFDPYLSKGRLEELCDIFGWSSDLGDEHSIIFAHGGVLNGNPFILARSLKHWMSSKTYRGSLDISWEESVEEANGTWHTKTHHETLRASVQHPFPEYANHAFIVFGNEAAPDLLFSRLPSKISQLENGLFDKIRKARAMKKTEKQSRDMGAGNTFTVMANREFDALFDAADRNHEVQFRLLFTPLAQQEMLKLLKDSKTGYGDNFAFIKMHMINVVQPAHMRDTDISGEPEQFRAYELAKARMLFNDYHNEVFRSIYFGIAPLLAIPLYQQYRPHSDIYEDDDSRKSCSWEHEAIANYYGEGAFKHPDCVTRSILKTDARTEADGTQHVCVTAHGYSIVERLDYVEVRGGDGQSYEVPVHWTDYHEVQHDTDMFLKETTLGSDEGRKSASDREEARIRKSFERKGAEYQDAVRRRSIVSALLKNKPA